MSQIGDWGYEFKYDKKVIEGLKKIGKEDQSNNAKGETMKINNKSNAVAALLPKTNISMILIPDGSHVTVDKKPGIDVFEAIKEASQHKHNEYRSKSCMIYHQPTPNGRIVFNFFLEGREPFVRIHLISSDELLILENERFEKVRIGRADKNYGKG